MTGTLPDWLTGTQDANQLMPMELMYPKDINPMTNTINWERMRFPMLVDSGAADTIIPNDWFIEHELRESEGQRLGAYYVAANGAPIRNEGERTLAMVTQEGQVRQMVFQVAKTKKALASVSKIVANGNRVIFDDEGSYIMNKATGELTALRLENGVYLLDVCIAPPKWQPEQGIPSEAIETLRNGKGNDEATTQPFGGPAK